MLLWTAAVVVGVIVAILFVVWPRRRYFPGPACSVSMLGSTKLLLDNLGRRHHLMKELHDRFGRIFQLQRGNSPMFFVYEPEDVKMMFSDNKPIFSDGIRTVLQFGANVLSLPANEQWAKHRRLISPLFAERFMREYTLMTNDKLASMSRKLRALAAANKDVDVLNVVGATTLDFIGICGFGVDFECLESEETPPFMMATNTILAATAREALLPWYVRLFEFEHKRKLADALAVIHKQCDVVRDAYREMKEANEFNRKAMISELLSVEESGEFTYEQVLSEMAILLVAGHETTATTVSWALYYIAQDRALQRRLQAEADAAVAAPECSLSDGGVTMKVIERLPLTKATFYEALRMRPTVTSVTRTAEAPFRFPSSPDVVCPKGSHVYVSLYSMSMNCNVWGNDVKTFKPDRQLDEEMQKRHPFAFLPFGGGQRVCLGRRFALQEGITLLMQVMRHFDLALPPNASEPGERLDITLKPTNLMLRFIPRQPTTL